MKNMFKWMVVLCCAVFAVQASVGGAPPRPLRQAQGRPNIIFFLVDGFGGHPQARTPNIDRLAKQGIAPNPRPAGVLKSEQRQTMIPEIGARTLVWGGWTRTLASKLNMGDTTL
jgi:hypothetical protein